MNLEVCKPASLADLGRAREDFYGQTVTRLGCHSDDLPHRAEERIHRVANELD